MANNKKKSQVAKKVNEVEKSYYYMTVKYRGQAPAMQEGDCRNGQLRFVDEDTFVFLAKSQLGQQASHERKFKDLVGDLHGKISMNAHGVTLHLYVKHGDYKNAMELCDIFEQELERMDERLACMDLASEVEGLNSNIESACC